MITLIEVESAYDDIIGGICPGCKNNIDECSYPADYSELIHPDIKGSDYDWKSSDKPVNRGMIWCDECNGRFVMDPFVVPTQITVNDAKNKYPSYDFKNYDNGDYSNDELGYWEVTVAHINTLVDSILYDDYIALGPLQKDILNKLLNVLHNGGRWKWCLNNMETEEYIKRIHNFLMKHNIYYHPIDEDDEINENNLHIRQTENDKLTNETVLSENSNSKSYLSWLPSEIIKNILSNITVISPLLGANEDLIRLKKFNLGSPVNTINAFKPEIPFHKGITLSHDGPTIRLHCTSQTGDEFYYDFNGD